MKAFVLLSFLGFSINLVGQDASTGAERSSTVPISTTSSPAPGELIDAQTMFAGINRPYSITPPMAAGIEAQLREIEFQEKTKSASGTAGQATPFAGQDAVPVSLAPKTPSKSTPVKKKAAPVSKKSTQKPATKAPQRQNTSKKRKPIQEALRSLFSSGNSRVQDQDTHSATRSSQGSRSRKVLNLGAE